MDEIIGFIKFSDYGKTNEKLHFSELIKGNVFFQSYQWFEENGTIAQQATEGSAARIQFLNGTHGWYRTPDYILASPTGIEFVDELNRNRSSILLNFPLGTDILNTEVINNEIEELDTNNMDVLIYPNNYKGEKKDEEGRQIYDFDELTIKLVNPERPTWRISCFVTVMKSDLDNEGKLTEDFLKNIANKNNAKGSIIYDKLGLERPWVWISANIMWNNLKRISKLKSGLVQYYSKKQYPYNRDDILKNPNVLLLAKEEVYSNQREFRLIIGGINSNFPIYYENNIVRFEWENDVRYGKILSELKNIILI